MYLVPIEGNWYIFYQRTIMIRSNQALERTTARRVFRFHMIKKVSVAAMLASGGGRSAFFR
jgi:hypothetical protein